MDEVIVCKCGCKDEWVIGTEGVRCGVCGFILPEWPSSPDQVPEINRSLRELREQSEAMHSTASRLKKTEQQLDEERDKVKDYAGRIAAAQLALETPTPEDTHADSK